jgi:putative ABC transport system substrate-binding protein
MRRREFIAGLGGAAAWPVVAHGQQPAVPVIGYLSGATEKAEARFTAAFRRGLGEQGYVESRNVAIEYRWADGQYDRLPTLAADLVARPVVVIYAGGAPSAQAAQSATVATPIVFTTGADPVEIGLVASLHRPSSNLTGASFLTITLTAKRIQLLHEMVPTITSIGFLVNPISPLAEAELKEAEFAASAVGVHLVVMKASTASEIEPAIATLDARRIGALLLAADTLFAVQGAQLVTLAARYAMPAIYFASEIVDAGGLMSYGPSYADALHLAGTYVGRILNGEKPANLPVQQSTRIEMVLNLKTAKALGLTFPLTFLGRADEVIE